MKELFHTGFQIIEKPDIKAGRKNADFGQGFYLSDDIEFSMRWARERKGQTTYLNRYELDTEGLNVKYFTRSAEWFEYIYANRANYPDLLAEYDVIAGPIANDTLYDTWGIIVSGLIAKEDALQLLMLGGTYEQIVIKTEKAAAALRFMSAESIPHEKIAAYRETVRREEERYQQEFVEELSKITEGED
ncbi:MAG: DUF3990 domain-containing protein [Ruminococcus sp.]|nr:DUF3990 domain-containing protein [Ruminococcus sp.]